MQLTGSGGQMPLCATYKHYNGLVGIADVENLMARYRHPFQSPRCRYCGIALVTRSPLPAGITTSCVNCSLIYLNIADIVFPAAAGRRGSPS